MKLAQEKNETESINHGAGNDSNAIKIQKTCRKPATGDTKSSLSMQAQLSPVKFWSLHPGYAGLFVLTHG